MISYILYKCILTKIFKIYQQRNKFTEHNIIIYYMPYGLQPTSCCHWCEIQYYRSSCIPTYEKNKYLAIIKINDNNNITIITVNHRT